MERNLKCLDCNQFKAKTQGELIRHLRKIHGTSYEDYILIHFFNSAYPKCKCGCGTDMKFAAYNPTFFSEYTSNHFPRKPHTAEAKQKIKVGYKKSMMEKYGVDNPMSIPECRQKILDTKERLYGNKNYNNMPKNKQTKLDKYGNENYQNSEKAIETNLERYGGRTFTATEEGKKQVRQTKLDRYGNSKYNNWEKNKQTKLDKYGYESEFLNPEWRKIHNGSTSGIENRVCNDIGAVSKFIFLGKEYDMILDDKVVIEIDGGYYHPKTLNELTLVSLNSAINDYVKTENIKGKYLLLRISADSFRNIKDIITFEDVFMASYNPDYSMTYKQVIITKEYLQKYINKKGKEKLRKYVPMFLKFLRTFQPEFPGIETTETLHDVVKKIQNYDLSRIKKSKFEFSNNISNIGVSYLKSNFKSYWNSAYGTNLTPVQAWKDDKIMKRIIEYRIGLNNSNEIFDFTLHQMIRGLSANRYTISFFKPLLAAAIYKEFLGDNRHPIVLDPCAGFGGRLLAFKSLYPNGTYIGIEPNPDTFNELVELGKNFSNVELHNCRIEDFDITDLQPDLTFTSIPYYETESYSTKTEYRNFQDWRDTFLAKIKSLPNAVINVPQILRDEFEQAVEYQITGNTSHFDKSKNQKFEYLLSFI